MFTKLKQHLWIRIEVTRGHNTQECFQRLHEAYGSALVRQGCCSGQPHVENSTVQLLASLLDADHQWTVHELAVEVWVCHKTVLHILHNILGYCKLAVHWIPHEISEVQQWHYYAVAQVLLDWYQREGYDFLRRICHYGQNLGSLMWTKLEMPIKWMEASRFFFSKENMPHTRGLQPTDLRRVLCSPGRLFHKIQCIMNTEASVTIQYMTTGKIS